MNKINVEIQYTPEDLQIGYTLHFKKLYPIRSKMLIVFGVLLIVLGVLMIVLKSVFNNANWLPVFYIVFGATTTIYHFWQYGTMGKRIYKKLPDFQQPFDYTISDDGIATKSTSMSSDVKWDHYKKAVITDDILLLYPNKFRFNLFPKRFFKENDFELLKNKIESLNIS